MKSRSFIAALFAALAFILFAPSAFADSQPTPGQCFHARDMWFAYQVGNRENQFPPADRKLLKRCQALEQERKAVAAKQPRSAQKIGTGWLFPR